MLISKLTSQVFITLQFLLHTLAIRHNAGKYSNEVFKLKSMFNLKRLTLFSSCSCADSNGREILSMCHVLKYLLDSSDPLINENNLEEIQKIRPEDWQETVRDLKGQPVVEHLIGSAIVDVRSTLNSQLVILMIVFLSRYNSHKTSDEAMFHSCRSTGPRHYQSPRQSVP